MDKSWIEKPRVSKEYLDGVNNFLNFTFEKGCQDGKILCPCKKCVNTIWMNKNNILDHLVCNGFVRGYTCWVFRGESILTDSCNQRQPSSVPHVHVRDNMQDMLQDIFGHTEVDNTERDGENVEPLIRERSNEEVSSFYDLVRDTHCELYPGCTKFSKLSFIVHLYHIKCSSGWSNKSFSLLLDLLCDAFPDDNKLPKTFYETKKIINKLGLGYDQIHACPNDCMLYWKDNSEDQSCMTCGTSRWISDENNLQGVSRSQSKKSKRKPTKILRYFPLKSRLQRLYISSKTVEHMRWHDEGRNKDGVLRHPADSEAWKSFDTRYPEFSQESRNVRLALASDGFNPFGIMSSSYSMSSRDDVEGVIIDHSLDTEAEENINDDSSGVRRKRGKTRMSDVWNLPTGHKIVIEFNNSDQPIKGGSSILGNFLGTIARNCQLCPLNYDDRRKVPKMYKDEIWGVLESKFTLSEKHKKWCLSSLSRKWGGYKCNLRGQYVTKYDSEDQCLRHKPDSIPKDQWAGLVSFWYSVEGMKRSARNMEIRKKQKFNHSCGRKSLARKADEMKETLGRDPTRVELFISSHTQKDGTFINDEAAAIIEKLQNHVNQNQNSSGDGLSENEIFAQVMGQEHSGRIGGMGLGPTPTQMFKYASRRFVGVEIRNESNMQDSDESSRLSIVESHLAEIFSILRQNGSAQASIASRTHTDSISTQDLEDSTHGNDASSA